MLLPTEDYHCVRYVCSLSSLFHVYAIELRITTVSVCHICLAHLCLGVSLYMSGLMSVSPSHKLIKAPQVQVPKVLTKANALKVPKVQVTTSPYQS